MLMQALEALADALGPKVEDVIFDLAEVAEGGELHSVLCQTLTSSGTQKTQGLRYADLKPLLETGECCSCLTSQDFPGGTLLDSEADTRIWEALTKTYPMLKCENSDWPADHWEACLLQRELMFAERGSPAFEEARSVYLGKLNSEVASFTQKKRACWPQLRRDLAFELAILSEEPLSEALIPVLQRETATLKGTSQWDKSIMVEASLVRILDLVLLAERCFISTLEGDLVEALRDLDWPLESARTLAEATVREVKKLEEAFLNSSEQLWVVAFQRPPQSTLYAGRTKELFLTFQEIYEGKNITKMVMPEIGKTWFEKFSLRTDTACAPLLETDALETVNTAIQLWVEASEGQLTDLGEALKTARELA